MGRSNKPILSDSERTDLENGYRSGKTHGLRQKCHLVLLKAEGRSSEDVAKIVGVCTMTVNNWIRRYHNEGIQGLQIKPGRGRKAKTVFDREDDEAALRQAVQENRQRLELAKEEFESLTGKTVTTNALRAFLKVVVHDING